MKLFSRRQFIDRIALTAGAVPLLQHRYLTIGKMSPPGEIGEYVDIEITHGKIRGLRIEGSVEIAERKAKQNGAPVYLYNLGYKSEVKIPGTDYPLGTPHAMDIRFKFYNEDIPLDDSQPEAGFGGSRPERFIASRNMAELWTNFARTGKPWRNRTWMTLLFYQITGRSSTGLNNLSPGFI